MRLTIFIRPCIYLLSLNINTQAFAQNQADTTINKLSTNFINSVIPKTTNGILAIKLKESLLSEIKASIRDSLVKRSGVNGKLVRDTFIFSHTEKAYVDSCLIAFKTFSWKKEWIDDINFAALTLVDTDTISPPNYQRPSLYHIVPPIFLRKGTVCLFYYDYFCGGLCGQGILAVYKKENNSWKYWYEIYNWVS